MPTLSNQRLRSASTASLSAPVRDHLLLGMTMKCACKFLEKEIGVMRVEDGTCSRVVRASLLHVSALLTCVAKNESAEVLAETQRGRWWKTGDVALRALPPKVHEGEQWLATTFRGRLTGYHLVALIREWLAANCAVDENLSVCEVLQRRGWDGVGLAHCFLSHAQSEHPGETLVGMQKAATQRSAGKNDAPRVWVDFFSLRQTEKGAFDPLEVVALIERVGWGMLQIDRRWTYSSVRAVWRANPRRALLLA